MATFYVLPPRPMLADRLAAALGAVLPGLDLGAQGLGGLVEWLSHGPVRPGTFLVPREELPLGEPLEQALADGYGAEPGDEIIEVRPASVGGPFFIRRWQLAAPARLHSAG